MSRLQDKAVSILRVLAIQGVRRSEGFADLDARYSAKAVNIKLLELVKRGYAQYGVHPRGAWLTPKGTEALDAAR